ncbi:MAG: glycosyltransferase family 1 protein [Candidatus Parcubacteria bacterium]|nr:glycosyltransferase family 1 protein [Candidatus Parcubacteria bacterium]
MQIAIDIRCLMSPTYSGVAQYTHNLLCNLLKIDRHNQYKLFYNSGQDVKKNLPNFDQPNVEIYGFNYPNKLINSSFLFLNYPKIEKLLHGCDLFFIPNLNFCALESATRKIITIHDLSYELYPHFFSDKQRLWHQLIRPKKLISQCYKIIADSENTKKDLQRIYQLPAEKINVIYPGLNHDFYKLIEPNHPKFKIIKEKYNLPEKFILYLGTIEPRKNIIGIIEAFNSYQAKNNRTDLNLVIAGAQGWKNNNVYKAAQNSPYNSQIIFTGYIAESDKPYLYSLAELFVFPSFYEGFGFPVLEAQACGVPVIAALNSSFPEILADSAALINPDSISQLAVEIETILNDSIYKQSIINKGIANCQRFSWQKCAQETLNLFSL